ncbi:MAG: hypothetical protein UHL07_04275 [Bacteroidaceae bacterium]|nr:hypothetical protein [Bacteroidaceae bacterium]
MKKTYMAPATAAANISVKESILDLSYGGNSKVTDESQVLSREDAWDDWDEGSFWSGN